MLTTSEAERLLEPVGKMFEKSGFTMLVRVEDPKLEIELEAGPEACIECLVPVSLMEGIVRNTLESGDADAATRPISITYPQAVAH